MSKTMAVAQEQLIQRRSVRSDQLFYVIAASAMLILTAIGFRFFFLHGKASGGGEITSQIFPLVVVHGLAMFGWVILFFVQSVLIVAGNRRLHTVIGPAGAVLAGIIVVLGSTAAALSVHFNPEGYSELGGARSFLAIMLAEMVGFGTFVALGMKYRRRVEIHRPMMLLATMFIISGSLARCPYVEHLAIVPPLYVYLPMLLFAGLLFLLQWGMTRVPNRWHAFGLAGLAATCIVSVIVGSSTVWNQMLGNFAR